MMYIKHKLQCLVGSQCSLTDRWPSLRREFFQASIISFSYSCHLRKILNFGHTIGHGFESAAHGKYLHGECVALGMLYMVSPEVKEELLRIYEELGFAVPKLSEFSMEEVKEAILHDKKASNKNCSAVFVEKIGLGTIEEWTMEQVLARLEQ